MFLKCIGPQQRHIHDIVVNYSNLSLHNRVLNKAFEDLEMLSTVGSGIKAIELRIHGSGELQENHLTCACYDCIYSCASDRYSRVRGTVDQIILRRPANKYCHKISASSQPSFESRKVKELREKVVELGWIIAKDGPCASPPEIDKMLVSQRCREVWEEVGISLRTWFRQVYLQHD